MGELVSVSITAYNSSETILETLESIKAQTWNDLELIISDDSSTDNTLALCQSWLDENKHFFSNVKLLSSDKNTGVSANANRGLMAACGSWIKYIGADDTLKPTCIEDNMLWIKSHKDVKVLFSQIEIYKDTFDPQNHIVTTPGLPYSPNGILAPDRCADSQYRMLLLSDRIHFSPSVFLNKDLLISIGGFDEKFRLLEDYPLWLKLTGKGNKLYFMDKVTVNYRMHSKAINNTGLSYLVNPNYFKSENFRRIYTYPFLPGDIMLYQRFNWYTSQVFRFSVINNSTLTNNIIHRFLTSYLNPFKYYIFVKKLIVKNLNQSEFYRD